MRALESFPEVTHLLVTCNEQGRMVSILRGSPRSYTVVLDEAVNDRGLAMTSSFTNMVVFGQCLAHAWSCPAYDTILDKLVAGGKDFLPVAAASAQEFATAKYSSLCMLGSGSLKGVAKESALKVLEMTAGGVKTMSESALGLRHGPMAALDTGTLLVCFASSDERQQNYEADLLREVRAKGIVDQRVVVGPAGATHLSGASERYLPINDGVPDFYRAPIDAMYGQLLGFYFSLAYGLMPDAPSPHGVITRVVGTFKIYK